MAQSGYRFVHGCCQQFRGREVVQPRHFATAWSHAIGDRPELRIQDFCGFDGDEQSKIDAAVSPGRYIAEAAYGENERTVVTVFRFQKIG